MSYLTALLKRIWNSDSAFSIDSTIFSNGGIGLVEHSSKTESSIGLILSETEEGKWAIRRVRSELIELLA